MNQLAAAPDRNERAAEAHADEMEHPLVLLVEDDLVVQESIVRLLEGSGFAVGALDSAQDFASVCASAQPCCVVVDLRLRGSSGWEVIAEKTRRLPYVGLVVASAHLDVRSVVRAMKSGATAVLEKPLDPFELLDAVQRACEHTRRTARAARARDDARERIARLTARELEVFERVVNGSASKTIAFELGISIRTVEAFRSRILSKTGAQSLADLVRLDQLSERGGDDAPLP